MKNRNTILIAIVSGLACFALCQQVQSATDTPDPGSKPVSNTADGQNALLSLTSGTYNTAVGFDSLLSLTTGKFCTAVGGASHLLNTADDNAAIAGGNLVITSGGPGNT